MIKILLIESWYSSVSRAKKNSSNSISGISTILSYANKLETNNQKIITKM